jgi:alkylresorcinol/alkylpyrone synthase
MFIASVGTATPESHYSQRECWEAIAASPLYNQLSRRSHVILKKVLLSNNGVSGRYLALDPLAEAFDMNPDALHGRFASHAPSLATAAAKEALSQLGMDANEVDGLVVSTCTGYLCPGLTSYVSERLGLRNNALLLDLVGQGCGAALPNLKTADGLIRSRQCDRVLSVCVEVCSAAFYLDDDPGVLISACLFGDGAGAAVLSRAPIAGQRAIEWLDFETLLCAADREFLRFEHQGGMLRNILAPEVPDKAAGHAARVLDLVLKRYGVEQGNVVQWITHAGGREVLGAIGKELGLKREAFQHSWDVLDNHGNLSSPFVLFVLKRALEAGAPGGLWWLNSFGAGFTSHGALLKVGDQV